MRQYVAVSPRDAVPLNTPNLTLAHHKVPSSSVVEHPTRSRRVVGSNPIWDSDFFRVYVSPRIYSISCCCYFVVLVWAKIQTTIKRSLVEFCFSLICFSWRKITENHKIILYFTLFQEKTNKETNYFKFQVSFSFQR